MSTDWKLVVMNFSGAIYTILVIIGIALLNLVYTCPVLYGEDNCGWPLVYAILILSQITINLMLFRYFNQRNQISYWRVKSSSFMEDSLSAPSSPHQPSSDWRLSFTALNIVDNSLSNDNEGVALSEFGGRQRLNFSVERQEKNSDGDVEDETKQKKSETPSILETKQVVRKAHDDPNRYQHRSESNRLFASFDGIYRNRIEDGESEQFNESAALLSNCDDTSSCTTTMTMTTRNANGSSSKWCAQCTQTTPRRCHHCPLCNICVLRKDHHCFLTGGCVGLANQRYFIVFLFWATIGSIYGTMFNFAYLNKFVAPWYPFGWVSYIGPIALFRWFVFGTVSFFNTCLAIMFSISIASCMGAFAFFCAQMFYTLHGYTMHDYHVGRLSENLESDGDNFKERLALVFGRRWWLNFLFPQFWLTNEMTPGIARNIFVSVAKDL